MPYWLLFWFMHTRMFFFCFQSANSVDRHSRVKTLLWNWFCIILRCIYLQILRCTLLCKLFIHSDKILKHLLMWVPSCHFISTLARNNNQLMFATYRIVTAEHSIPASTGGHNSEISGVEPEHVKTEQYGADDVHHHGPNDLSIWEFRRVSHLCECLA